MITLYLDKKSEDQICPEVLFQGTGVTVYRNSRNIANVSIHKVNMELLGSGKFYNEMMLLIPSKERRKVFYDHRYNFDFEKAPEKIKVEVKRYSDIILQNVLKKLASFFKRHPERILWALQGHGSDCAESATRQAIHEMHNANHKCLEKLSKEAANKKEWKIR